MRRQLTFLLSAIFGFSFLSTCAQSYLEEATQHRFAQTYFGINTLYYPTSGVIPIEGVNHAFSDAVIPRITLGGLHFWGRVDFKMSLSLAHFTNRKLSDLHSIRFEPGADFSCRYYPWQIKKGRIRPFLGASLNQMLVGLERSDLDRYVKMHFALSPVAGISLRLGEWQINADAMWMPDNRIGLYTDRLTPTNVEMPEWYYSFGIVRFFDVTKNHEKRLKSGETDAVASELKTAGKLNSITLGVAPSMSYFLKTPRYSTGERKGVPAHSSVFTWDLGIGYLFNKQGIHAGVSYRDYTSSRENYDLEHLIRRRSIALEVTKFLFNWNGFAPFVGPSLGYDRWAMAEFDGDERIGDVVRTTQFAPGIIFGWDISPSPVETWVLRTNLRYYPQVTINDLEGSTSKVDQFEFNFIQAVIYPQRIINVRRAKKKLQLL